MNPSTVAQSDEETIYVDLEEPTDEWTVFITYLENKKLKLQEVATCTAMDSDRAIIKVAEEHPVACQGHNLVALPADLARGREVRIRYVASL